MYLYGKSKRTFFHFNVLFISTYCKSKEKIFVCCVFTSSIDGRDYMRLVFVYFIKLSVRNLKISNMNIKTENQFIDFLVNYR